MLYTLIITSISVTEYKLLSKFERVTLVNYAASINTK